MNGWRTIKCPQCGGQVSIPWYWVFGIEGIFRCKGCGLPFRTGYKMGAALFALALTFGIVTVQLMVWIFGIWSMPLFVIAAIPLWIMYGFGMRKGYMMWKTKRNTKKKTKAERV